MDFFSKTLTKINSAMHINDRAQPLIKTFFAQSLFRPTLINIRFQIKIDFKLFYIMFPRLLICIIVCGINQRIRYFLVFFSLVNQ